ncbi:hypothetical protein PHYPSEUDO_004757 [Phytophthora pseudosyringae]|uniref:Uncharacterized protein n=1 Tax=Phytophthora pseudosyringae TaxID=221518 RepID=A0A8T1VQN6_9STRA|nr:hypothetical protein PHYPSEUDO_004757 [Phytophthora pseudosyringae]
MALELDQAPSEAGGASPGRPPRQLLRPQHASTFESSQDASHPSIRDCALMVNCKGVASSPKSPVNHEICRYCRTVRLRLAGGALLQGGSHSATNGLCAQRVCEECYVAATSRNSTLQSEVVTPVRHQHVCLACTRVHPEAKELRSPRRPSRLPRLHSAPSSGGPRIDTLSNMARERRRWPKPSAGLSSTEAAPQQQTAARRGGSPKKSTKPAHAELLTLDQRRRRHTSAIAPTSRSAGPARPSRARQLLRANATELQAVRRQQNATELNTARRHELEAPTSYSCDFTRTTAPMAIRDATSTDMELTMVDLQSYDQGAGVRPIVDVSDDPTELRLSTVDLRLPKYKVHVPPPTKRGRRASAADPASSALTPISIEHLAAIDAKLSSVELELKRYDAPGKENRKKMEQATAPSSISSDSCATAGKHSQPTALHLSPVDLRPRHRRHTATDALTQTSKVSRHRRNQEPVVEDVEMQGHGGVAPFQRKKNVEPVDFHLSTFDLKSRRQTTDSKPEPNQVDAVRHESRSKKEKMAKVKEVPATLEQTTPKYSKNEPCDLAYLENFRSYTV